MAKRGPTVVITDEYSSADSKTVETIRDELRRWRETKEATVKEIEALQSKLADIEEHITHLDAALHVVKDIDRLAATEPIGFKEKRSRPCVIITTSAGTPE